NADPVTYFGRAGIKADEVLQDAKDIYAKVPRGKGLGVHVLTGPIYIEGAESGDALEVRVLDLEFRVPYGVNNTGPGSGVLPDLVATPSPRVIKTDSQRRVAFLPGGIELPLGPFLGIMAVAPPPDLIVPRLARPTNGLAILTLRCSASARPSISQSLMRARCSSLAIRTAYRATARSTGARSSSRSPAR